MKWEEGERSNCNLGMAAELRQKWGMNGFHGRERTLVFMAIYVFIFDNLRSLHLFKKNRDGGCYNLTAWAISSVG